MASIPSYTTTAVPADDPLAGWDPYAFVAWQQQKQQATDSQRALEEAWKLENPAPEYASQYDAYSSPWYDASLGQNPADYMGQVYRAEGRYSPTDASGNTVGDPLMFKPGSGYALTDKSGKVLARATTPEELSALAEQASSNGGDWYIFGTDGQGNFDFNPGTATYSNVNNGSFGSMILPMLAIAGAGFGLNALGLGAAGGGAAAAAPAAAPVAGGVGGTAGGVGGGVGGALSGAGGAIGGAGAGLGGITVVGAPTAGLTTGGLIGGGLGLGGLAGLSQLANPVATGSAASGSTGVGAETAVPFDGITVSHAPIGGLTAAETAALGGAATAGGVAATSGAGAQPLPDATGPDIVAEAARPNAVGPGGAAAAIGAITIPELVPNLSGLESVANNLPDLEPTSGGNTIGGVVAGGAGAGAAGATSGGNLIETAAGGAGAAGVANAVSGANGGTTGGGTGGGGLGLSDYLTIAGLGVGTLGDLLGGGGGGGNNKIPAGFGAGGSGVDFNAPLPTLPSTSPFSPQSLAARPVSKTYDQWIVGGHKSPESYFNYVPQQAAPSVSQDYVRPAPSVVAPQAATPTLASLAVPKAPGADLLAAMLGNREEPAQMARGGDVEGLHSHETRSFAVRGPGSGRDDKVPALLSDGEYVMDAETVALLGDGSSKAGADRLDEFRVNIRKHKGRKLAKGGFSVSAKRPEKYLPGGTK